jgi:hypothetical protein
MSKEEQKILARQRARREEIIKEHVLKARLLEGQQKKEE